MIPKAMKDIRSAIRTMRVSRCSQAESGVRKNSCDLQSLSQSLLDTVDPPCLAKCQGMLQPDRIPQNRTRMAKMNRVSDLTKSGLQSAGTGVVV